MGLIAFGMIRGALRYATPEGRKEIAEETAADAARAARQAQEDKAAQVAKAADDAKKAVEAAEAKRKGRHCLSPWDGSESAFVEAVKAELRDPNSFEHAGTSISPVDKDGQHAIIMKYRAKNGFGGMDMGYATAKISNADCSVSNVVVE